MKVPYFCRFHVYARRQPLSQSSFNHYPSSATKISSSSKSNNPVHVRILCITEPARAVHPLELQEDFSEIVRSEYVEIRDKSEIEVNFGGNLYKSQEASTTTATENCVDAEFEYDCGSHKLIFHPFNDNRQGFSVKRRNENNPYGRGSISFVTSGDQTLYEAKIDLSRFTYY